MRMMWLKDAVYIQDLSGDVWCSGLHASGEMREIWLVLPLDLVGR